jgi:hypothetical protein
MTTATATHTWITDGTAINVCCNGGNVYLPTDDQADPSVEPKATYEVSDYDEAGNEEWIVLVCGRATTGQLVPIKA